MKETLEEASIIRYGSDQFLWAKQRDGFIEGAKWQQKRSYSEEEVITIIEDAFQSSLLTNNKLSIEQWFEQFKKK